MKTLGYTLLQNPCKWNFCQWNLRDLAIVTVLGLVTCCSITLAQSGAGSIQGTVQDSTRAAIPGATISVVNQATNITATTKSNGVGFYEVPDLFAGNYTVTVTAPDMKTYRTTIQLLVAQAAVINPVMTAGAVTQQVLVSADTVQLTTTENGAIGATLENARVDQLPMNGRELVTLTGMTTPGLEEGGQRANGLMPEALEYVADGVSLSNRYYGGEGGSGINSGAAQLPDPDAVQEVRIETTGSSAQFAEPATAIITTKSGTNSLHGAFFETARNNGLGVATSRQDVAPFTVPHLVRNEFGASAGGPIVLPHVYHGKDKSFWFFAYERYSLRSSTGTLMKVPTTAMRGGDFSGLINSSGVLQQLYDPATTSKSSNCNGSGAANNYCRTPFSNNQISSGRVAPATKTLYDITPTPTSTANPLVADNLSAPNIDNNTIPTYTFRLDHNFSEKNRAYLRYTSNMQQLSSGVGTLAADGIPAEANGISYTPIANFGTGIGYTHIFSPTFFSETIASGQWFSEYSTAGGNPYHDYESELGLPNNFGARGFPEIGQSGQIFYNFAGTEDYYGLSQIVTTIDENLTKMVGRHQMQFGGRYRHERFGDQTDQADDLVDLGAYATALENPSSGTNYTATSNTGNGNGDFFLGAAYEYKVDLEPPYMHYHDMEFDAYYQDNYHVSRNFTVNLGLRWEAHPAPWVKNNLMNSFDFANDAMVTAAPMSTLITEGYTTSAIYSNLQWIGVKFETPQEAGMSAKMMRDYDLTFSPRVGFAYQPFGGKHGTVIRGAYGRYIYSEPTRNYMHNHAENAPFKQDYFESYVEASYAPDGLPNYLLRAPQTVYMGSNSANVVNTGTTESILPGQAEWTNSYAMPPDFVTQTNLTIEQPLKGNSALRLSWLWAHGTNLDHYYNFNNNPSSYVWQMAYGIVPPTGGTSVIGTSQANTYSTTATGPYDQTTWSGASVLDVKNGWSNDNALQANYQRLFHSGIAYQITYVWSKPLRFGGNFNRDSEIDPAANYLGVLGSVSTMTPTYGTPITPVSPPPVPAGKPSWAEYHALDRFEGYTVDQAIPKQHITFNGIVDLPFGRGKRFLGNSNWFVNELVGGFQIAGDGNILSQDFAVASSHWGPTNPLHVYKHKAPITDCRSGVCYKEYEWFNGYIAPKAIAGNSCATTTSVVTSLPSDWAPYQSPIDTDCVSTDAAYKYYGDDEVSITLPGGKPTAISYSPGPSGANPFAKTVLNGPFNYTVDLSLFKVFPITERVKLRFNMDTFNAFNVQGYTNPNTTDGTEGFQPNGASSSYNIPRQVQLTLRLTF